MSPRPAPAPPPQVAELVECLGVVGTLRLIEVRGGVRVHVPKPANVRRSYLAHIIEDHEALAKLSALMGGSAIDVPLCREWRARVLLHEGGRSQAEIARIVGVTDHYVRQLAHTDWTPQPRAHKALQDRQMKLPLG